MIFAQRHFRFAPSPTYYLHAGHAVSACLNALMAEKHNGRLSLRIEDIDNTRCKPHYMQAILDDLHWLGIERQPEIRIQSQHIAGYDRAVRQLAELGLLYHCQCSRKMLLGFTQYPQTCRHRVIADTQDLQNAIAQNKALRINCDKAFAFLHLPIDERIEDHIIRRKDIGCSYHMAVVVDDAIQNITDIVRGEEFAALVPFHRLLQKLLKLPVPRYWHHPMLTDINGEKLAKSRKNTPRIRTLPPSAYWDIAARWLETLCAV